MASLFVKDVSVADRVAKMAARLGTTKTEIVRRGLDALEDKVGPPPTEPVALTVEARTLIAKLDAWRDAHPLPLPTGLKADKAFFDAMWDDL